MLGISLLLAVQFVWICLSVVDADVRFVCPRPLSADSTSQLSCTLDHDFEANMLEVLPGPMTLQWEDTKVRIGASSRIELRSWDDDSVYCVLLDYIPHNDAANIETPRTCKQNGYPLGGCEGAYSYITVQIPDILCDRCYLQLRSIYPSDTTGTRACRGDATGQSFDCRSYVSCSNIRIRPSGVGRAFGLSTCREYKNNLVGHWPYMEQLVYRAIVDGSSFNFSSFVFYMDYTNLRYEISIDTRLKLLLNQDQIRISLLPEYHNMYTIRITGYTFSGELALTQGTSWDQLLLGNKLSIVVQTVFEQVNVFNLELESTKYRSPEYYQHGVTYSPSGFLDGYLFTGGDALNPEVVQLNGKCAPPARKYHIIALNDEGLFEAFLSYSIASGYLYIDGLSDFGPVIEIRFNGRIVNVEVPPAMIQGNKITGVIRIHNKVEKFETVTIRKLYSSYTMAPTRGVVGTMTHAYFDGRVALNLADDGTVAAYVIVIPKLILRRNITLTSASINGPGISVMSGAPVWQRIQQKNSDDQLLWLKQFKVTHSKMQQWLWDGQVSAKVLLNIENRAIVLNGQIDAIDGFFCEDNPTSYFCTQTDLLSPPGSGRFGRVIQPEARATYHPVGNGRVLLSIKIYDLPSSMLPIPDVWVVYESSVYSIMPGYKFASSPLEHGVYIAQKGFEETTNFMFGLQLRELFLLLDIPENRNITESLTIIEYDPYTSTTSTTQRTRQPYTGDPTPRPQITTGPPVQTTDRPTVDPNLPCVCTSPQESECDFGRITTSCPECRCAADPCLTTNCDTTEVCRRYTYSCGDVNGCRFLATCQKINVIVRCGFSEVGSMNVRFDNLVDFHGNVYADGRATCKFERTQNAYFRDDLLDTDPVDCGVQVIEYTTKRVYAISVLMIENHDYTVYGDMRYTIGCVFDPKNPGITAFVDGQLINHERQTAPEISIDQTYSLYVTNGSHSISSAELDQRVTLVIQMAGQDEDEKSFRVRECWAQHGEDNFVFIKNFCQRMEHLMSSDGFMTKNGSAALRGLEIFKFPGDPSEITYHCIIEPCPKTTCDRNNCVDRENHATVKQTVEVTATISVCFSLPCPVYRADNSTDPTATGEETDYYWIWIIVGCVFGAVVIAAVIGAIFSYKRMIMKNVDKDNREKAMKKVKTGMYSDNKSHHYR